MVAGSGAALPARNALELEHDPQRGRDFGNVLLAFCRTPEQPGELPPGELGAVLRGQMLLDQHPHVGERLQRQHIRG
jgi:hypothetical protein